MHARARGGQLSSMVSLRLRCKHRVLGGKRSHAQKPYLQRKPSLTYDISGTNFVMQFASQKARNPENIKAIGRLIYYHCWW